MAERIVEGLWDCPYCGEKGIGGLTKHCPQCGHPQDDDTKFYMGTKKRYLEDEIAKEYGKGADWVCAYCGSLNRYHYQYCSNCAAPKDESEKDYFTPDKSSKASETKPEEKAAKNSKEKKEKRTPKKKRRWPWILLLILAIMTFVGWPRTKSGTVEGKRWERSIDVEAYRTVEESDWTVPEGGRVLREAREIHHYDRVLDHYETRYRQVAEQVRDGEDTHTDYRDNGDGTFTEHTYTTPRYRTEYHEESYQEPIYRNEPRYATKYYYEINKWVYDHTEESGGTEDEPYWPTMELKELEREGDSNETYELTVVDAKEKSYTFEVPQEYWEKYEIGTETKLTIVMGRVSKLDDLELGKD